jgi:hypothetical protein
MEHHGAKFAPKSRTGSAQTARVRAFRQRFLQGGNGVCDTFKESSRVMYSSDTLAGALLTEEPDIPTTSNLYRSPLSFPAPVKSFERECDPNSPIDFAIL